MNDALTVRIARRLKARREEMGLSQDVLAREMGFSNRQTLAAIETEGRRIRPGELATAARVLKVSPDYFTDPYSGAGEASFSFRGVGDDPVELARLTGARPNPPLRSHIEVPWLARERTAALMRHL